MLLIPVNYEKQELRSDKNSTKCSLTPAENRRYCQWQKERTKNIVKETNCKGNTAIANRKYKDTVFRMLFSDRKNLLSLYNAINETSYTDAAQLEIVTLENAIYMGMKNDLAFIINTNLFLYEHQSTYNPNMPLRDFILHFQRISENGRLEVLVYLNKTENTHTEFYRIL